MTTEPLIEYYYERSVNYLLASHAVKKKIDLNDIFKVLFLRHSAIAIHPRMVSEMNNKK